MIQRNIKLIKIDNFFAGLWPLSTLVVVYFAQITHSYAIAMLVFSTSGIVRTLFEIPTGVWSDKIGRKKSLICSGISIFFACILWAVAGELNIVWMLFAGSVFWGFSDALLSGPQDALMYETMEELGEKDNYDILYSQAGYWNQAGLALASVSAAIITYFYSLQTLAWISLFPLLGSLVIAFLYVEPKRTKEQHQHTSLHHFLIAFKELWRNKRARFYAILDMLDESVGMSTHRFESVYYDTLIASWLVNIARLVKQISGMISFWIIPYVKKINTVQLLFSSMIGGTIFRMIGLIINTSVSPFLISLVNLFYGTNQTASSKILQTEFTAHQRATMASIISFFSGISMAIMMWLFGYLADVFSPRDTLFVALGFKVLFITGALIVLKRKKKHKTIY